MGRLRYFISRKLIPLVMGSSPLRTLSRMGCRLFFTSMTFSLNSASSSSSSGDSLARISVSSSFDIEETSLLIFSILVTDSTIT